MASFWNKLRTRSKFYMWLGIVFVLLAIFIGYLQYRSWSSRQLLSLDILSPPCWNQLCPNQSTRSDVLSTLKSLNGIVNETIYDNNSEIENLTRWWFIQPVHTIGTAHYNETENIEYISIGIPDKMVNLKLIFEHFGDPDLIFPVIGCADSTWLDIWLLYPRLGYGVEIFVPSIKDHTKFSLGLDHNVTEVVYFSGDNYFDVLLASDGIHSQQSIQELQEFITPWAGFDGEIEYFDTCN